MPAPELPGPPWLPEEEVFLLVVLPDGLLEFDVLLFAASDTEVFVPAGVPDALPATAKP